MNPKLFISYSWSDLEHENWVINLATELRESGVDVIFDKWELKPGIDSHQFMESSVTDDTIKKVILICDKVYMEKANKRTGGVGTEAQIMSAEIYAQQDEIKFAAVIREKDEDGKAYVPAYYKSRIYIDLSDDDRFHIKPPIGKKPSFLDETVTPKLATTSQYKRVIHALKNHKDLGSVEISAKPN